MKITNMMLFIASMVAAAVFAGFVGERVWFLTTADRTTGVVESVSKKNSRCGGRRSRYDCTVYSGWVRYEVAEVERGLKVSAGSTRGHNKPLSHARYKPGAKVPIVYSRADPGYAYRDELWDVWGAPLMALFVHLSMLFGSFKERRGSGSGAGAAVDAGVSTASDFDFSD